MYSRAFHASSNLHNFYYETKYCDTSSPVVCIILFEMILNTKNPFPLRTGPLSSTHLQFRTQEADLRPSVSHTKPKPLDR